MIEVLFPIVLAEVVLGGGGRTFAFGSITLRMVLFGATLVATLIGLLSARQREGLNLAFLLVLAFFTSLLPGLLVDVTRGTPVDVVAPELQPILFWLCAPFFALAIQDARTARKAASIFIYGGFVVGLVTSLLMTFLYTGVIGFFPLYLWADKTNELFFRGFNNFFYKGHFFVGIALVFCVVLKPRWWKTMTAVLVLSIALSLTRGLYLAVALAIMASFVTNGRRGSVLILAAMAFAVFLLYSQSISDILFDPTRLASSETRSRDLLVFWNQFDFMTLLTGDGTGELLNGRSDVENSFLWAIWRFGIVGLLFMLFPFFLCLRYFRTIGRDNPEYTLASAFFFGVVMLYILTAFNPFVNNSIGLMYLLCAIFSLRRLSREPFALSAPQQNGLVP